jgi:hypothetical protein
VGIAHCDDRLYPGTSRSLNAVNDTVELVEEDHREPVATEDTDLLDSHETLQNEIWAIEDTRWRRAGYDGMVYPGQITKRQSSVRMIDQSACALERLPLLDWRYH